MLLKSGAFSAYAFSQTFIISDEQLTSLERDEKFSKFLWKKIKQKMSFFFHLIHTKLTKDLWNTLTSFFMKSELKFQWKLTIVWL